MKPQKHKFGRMLERTTPKLDLDMNNKLYVVDGGWIFHLVNWTSGAAIKTIFTTYVNYVRAKFKEFNVVIDAYGEKASLNKMLGRALDPRANGTWLSKLTGSSYLRRTDN